MFDLLTEFFQKSNLTDTYSFSEVKLLFNQHESELLQISNSFRIVQAQSMDQTWSLGVPTMASMPSHSLTCQDLLVVVMATVLRVFLWNLPF